MNYYNEIATALHINDTVQSWIVATVVAGFALLALKLVKAQLVRHLRKISDRTETDLDDLFVDMLQGTKFFLLLIGAIYLGSFQLDLANETRTFLEKACVIALWIQIGLWANRVLTYSVTQYQRRKAGNADAAVTVTAIRFISRLIVFSIIALLLLDNLGVDVTALIATMGVGSIAIALAVQNILGDLLSSISIMFDKPFVIGDFIVLGSDMGTVEHIGLKTTRLKSISGEQLVISNSDLLSSRIRNYGRMAERRVVFGIGVTYDTPAEKLESLPKLIETIVTNNSQARFDRSHFKNFGDFSLNFETVYYVTAPDYATYMDIQQAINLALFKKCSDEGIEFAFPTQTIHVEKQAS